MARTRTTIKRIDPWSILKFAFVANLVLLAIELLVGAIAWAMIRRLELIETVCDLVSKFGINECAVDGQQLFDTVLVLGLLGVVIQTGIFVFLTFLANLIFDLVGGVAITLEDETPTNGATPGRISSSKSARPVRTVGAKPKVKSKATAKVTAKAKAIAKPKPAQDAAASVRSGTGKIPPIAKPERPDPTTQSGSAASKPGGGDSPLFGGS